MVNGIYSNYRAAENRRKITVNGEGTVKASPDMATATLGVRTENLNLQDAQAENAKNANDLVTSLVGLGIPKEDIRTADYRIDPIYTYEEGKQLFQGYRVTHLYTITIRDADQVGQVIDTAVANGANEVMNIQFTVAEPQAYYNQALSLAVIDSFHKAETIARTFGIATQPQLLTISEESQKAVPGPYMVASFEKTAGSGTPIEPGKLEIKAALTATYTIS
jgi:uncharacterized protein